MVRILGFSWLWPGFNTWSVQPEKRIKLQKDPIGNPGTEKYCEIKFLFKKKKENSFVNWGLPKEQTYLHILVREWVEG